MPTKLFRTDVSVNIASDERFQSLYESQFDFLVSVAVRKFRVPQSEAETLVHDVFLSYFRRGLPLDHEKAWLLGAICNASRYYWRVHGRDSLPDSMKKDETEVDRDDDEDSGVGDELAGPPFDRIDPSTSNILEKLPDQLAVHEAIERLPPRAQQVLLMHYFDGFSAAEIAERLGVTRRYTQKLIHQSLQGARSMYGAKEKKRSKQSPATDRESVLNRILADFVDAYRHVGS